MELVGREEQLASIKGFIDGAPTQPAAFVLEGEAGIGKSTLWLAGTEHACLQNFLVLSSRPAEAERGLAYAGLGDLLDGVLDGVMHALSPPRRRALEVALLRKEGETGVADPRALGIATRSVLQQLATEHPVLIAIDDLQWLDAASAAILAFALRRLAGGRVRLLLASRSSDQAQPSIVEQALGPESVRRLVLGPLSIGALHQLLRSRLGRPFGRQTLLRIHEQSGGNPFFALELARVLDLDSGSLEPFDVPQTLEALVHARMSDLPAPTRKALALASAIGATSQSLLERAGVSAEVFEPAIVARVIERKAGTIRFTHPLLSSVFYQGLGSERPAVHARIAEIVEDPQLRARHLALSRSEPDAAIATKLDEAARLAADRGAWGVAADLCEHAVRLTAPKDRVERHRRALAAARAHQAAGEWTRARAIATDLVASTENGSMRAQALVLLAELETVDRGVALLDEALREASSQPSLQSALYTRLAWASRFRVGYVRALEHASAGLALAQKLNDEVLRERARVVQAILGWFVGDAEAPQLSSVELPARAHDFAAAVGGAQLVQEATQAVVNTLATSGRRDEARAFLHRDYREWKDRDEPRSARALWGLSWVEFWAGRWQLAATHAAEAHDISILYGIEVPQDHLPIAVVALHRGQFDLACQHSRRALELADEQFGLRPPQHLAVLGIAALGRGETATGVELLVKAERQAAALGWGEPTIRWWTGDFVDALIEQGRIDDAERVTDVWAADAERLRRDWVLAHVARCRGLLAAARGNIPQALSLIGEAVTLHEKVDDPFGRTRSLLALGIVRRRDRQKRPARDAIETALGSFESLGAAAWAARARAELGRIGGRTHEHGLTEAERRVAELVAKGRTNREVAAALFLGERTISSHLTQIYAKLGVRSRTELARRLN